MTPKALAFLAAFAAAPAAAQPQIDFAKVELKPTLLAPGVWMIEGAGGNIGLVSGGGMALVIDDQYPPLADKVKAAVASLTQKPLRFVVNTHWHGDHTGGNAAMGEAGAPPPGHHN